VQQLTIGIDGYNLAMPHGTGIATYGINLARTLQLAGHEITGVFGLDVGRDPALRETLFFDRVVQPETGRNVFGGRWHRRSHMFWASVNRNLSPLALEVSLTDRVDKHAFADRLPTFSRLTSTPGLFSVAQRHFSVTGRFLPLRMKAPPKVMHWTYPLPVRLVGACNIYTIHDLVPLRLPYTTLTDKPRFARLLRGCVNEGDHLCTVSQFSRDDIIDQCGVAPERISNTYQSSFLPEQILTESFENTARQVKGIFGLNPQSFFLFFGALEPKKNIGRLLEAYLGLQASTPLVLVGARAWMSEGELSLLPPDDKRIVRLDYLSRNTLLRLIRVARAVLFPSIFEGFGLPVLEAMQLGAPVLTSNTSSLPEVAGDAAVLVNPYSVADIARGIARLDQDQVLRAQLSAAGPRQAALYSQAAYLARLEAMYIAALAADAGFTNR
jgi:glycosyltransferase involved in cell wall biosynthesis